MRRLKLTDKLKSFISAEKRGAISAAVLICGALLLFLGGRGLGGNVKDEKTLEQRTAELCSSVDGVGECRVMITYGEDGEVYAVAILCDGGDTVAVRREITELASSLFGIGANRVSVLKISK